MRPPETDRVGAEKCEAREIGVSLPAGAQTLCGLIDALPSFGERPALIALQKEGADTWSFRRLGEHVSRLSAGLGSAGLTRGANAALLARNCPEWIVACLAVIRSGAVAVPVDAQLGEKTLTRVLHDSDARFVFTTADELRRLESLCGGAGPRLILLDADASDPRSWRQLLSDTVLDIPASEPDEAATLFYTSGTTGVAKGVPLTHRNLVFQVDAVAAEHLVTVQDRLLLPLPLHHVYPFVIGMLLPLALGLAIVLPQATTGPQVIRAIRDGGATAVIGVPRLYAALCAGLEARVASRTRLAAFLFRSSLGLSCWLRRRFALRAGKVLLRPLHREIGPHLRIMASGGAPLDPELAGKLESLGWQVAIGYGLTETSPLLTLNVPGSARLDTVGKPIPGVEIRIDASAIGREASERAREANGGAGEVLARGPSVFSGYRNLPEKTAQAFTADGWFRTGDIGFLDGENYLRLTGRLSSMIVTEGGENIQPEDVEDAYLESPLIGEIGVLQREGRLVAVIVPKLSGIRAGGADAIETAIRQAVQTVSARLPSYQRISDFVLTRDLLARTRLGKIRRHLLPGHFEKARATRDGCAEPRPMSLDEMSDEDRAVLDNAAARQVWDLLTSRYHDKRLTPGSSPQLDLAIDSMEWLNLTLEIRERAGVELSEEAIGRVETIRDLLHEVSDAAAASPKASWLDDPEGAISAKQRRWLRPQNLAVRIASEALYDLDYLLSHALFRLHVIGTEHLPREQPFVLIPNHLSYLDPPLLGVAIGRHHMRKTYWGGWTGVMTTNPFNRLLSRVSRVVPIDPDRAIFSSLAFGAAVLRRGNNLVWFPEGGISRSGELQPFRPGIGILLESHQTLAVPVAIAGTGRALPAGQFVPRPGRITIEFGKPLTPRELAAQGSGDRPADRIVCALREHVAALQQNAH